MEAITSIPVPSLTPAPGGQTQTSMTGNGHSFASTLLRAVTGRNEDAGQNSQNSFPKTTSPQPGTKPRETSTQESNPPESPAIAQNQASTMPSSDAAMPTGINPSDISSEVVKDPKSTETDGVDPTLLFPAGSTGYLLNTPQILPPADLQKTSPPLPGDDLNIPQNLDYAKIDAGAVSDAGTVSGSQLKNATPSIPVQDTVSPATFRAVFDTLSLQKKDDLNALQDLTNIDTGTVSGSQAKNITPSVPLQDTSPAPLRAVFSTLSLHKQDDLNALQGLTNIGTDTVSSSQVKNIAPYIPLQDTSSSPLRAVFSTLSLQKQDNLNALQGLTNIGTDTTGSSQVKNIVPYVPLQDTVSPTTLRAVSFSTEADSTTTAPLFPQGQSTMPPTTSKNTLPTGAAPGSSTLIAQQLQKILSINEADTPIFSQQPASQIQIAGQDPLSRPFLGTTDTPTEQTSPILAVTAGAVVASLAKGSPQAGKPADKHLSGIADNHPGILTKADMLQQKVEPKVQEKDALPQNPADQGQTPLPTLTSTTDTMGIGQQAGQISFGNILTQNPQPGQQTTGTTGGTGSNALPLWTPSQENALVNQVMQNFHFTSNSPTSKLVLKLHPEELGELKIDLHMKDGAIKANIFTHSEQVQQVLEKYIPKLKSFMEQQGLTVDDILVTNTSGNVDGQNLFQEDFANNHDFSHSGKSAKTATFTDLTFENIYSKTSDTILGVNVTV